MANQGQTIAMLQAELQQTRAQVLAIAQSHEALKTAHEALNQEAERLFKQRADDIRSAEDRLRNLLFRQQFDLLDLKDLKPGDFKGRRTENFKPWARKLKAYCNGKRDGFRKALEWAETQQSEIQSLAGMSPAWDHAEAANTKLYDFLLQLCGEDAQLRIEKPELEGRGFGAWRLLVA